MSETTSPFGVPIVPMPALSGSRGRPRTDGDEELSQVMGLSEEAARAVIVTKLVEHRRALKVEQAVAVVAVKLDLFTSKIDDVRASIRRIEERRSP